MPLHTRNANALQIDELVEAKEPNKPGVLLAARRVTFPEIVQTVLLSLIVWCAIIAAAVDIWPDSALLRI